MLNLNKYRKEGIKYEINKCFKRLFKFNSLNWESKINKEEELS